MITKRALLKRIEELENSIKNITEGLKKECEIIKCYDCQKYFNENIKRNYDYLCKECGEKDFITARIASDAVKKNNFKESKRCMCCGGEPRYGNDDFNFYFCNKCFNKFNGE